MFGAVLLAIFYVPIVLTGIITYALIIHKKKKNHTPNTPLSTYEESYAVDKITKEYNNQYPESISDKYQKMMENPLQYNEKERKEITKTYKKLILGHIKDPNGIHTPDEYNNTLINPDYIRYLKNQIRVLGKNTWHKKELDRIKPIEKEEKFEADFVYELGKRGAPYWCVNAMASPERMEKYTPHKWDKLIKQILSYDGKYPRKIIIYLLKNFNDDTILYNKYAFELCDMLIKNDFPDIIINAYLKENIDAQELLNIFKMIKTGTPPKKALNIIKKQQKNYKQIKNIQEEVTKNLI